MTMNVKILNAVKYDKLQGISVLGKIYVYQKAPQLKKKGGTNCTSTCFRVSKWNGEEYKY